MANFLLFTLEGLRYALPLSAALRVVRMVALSPLPAAPPSLAGLVSLHGEVVPVIDPRPGCGLPPRAPRFSDHLLLTSADGRTLALAIDGAEEVFTGGRIKGPGRDKSPLTGAITVGGELVPILDLGRLLATTGIQPLLEGTGAAPA